MSSSPAWHEDDTFWEAVEPVLFPSEKIEIAGEEVEQLLSLASVEDGARVLDIPCGIGRHAVEFATRGFAVTAVDVTQTYLDTAAERAAEVDTNIEFVQADMRDFCRPEAFDLIINVWTSFGYFENRADDERAARNFYESLSSGGRLVMSLTSKELVAREFKERTWTESDGVYLLEEHEVVDDWSRIENRWIVVVDDEVHEYCFARRLYSAYELSELLRSVGFNDVNIFGSFGGVDFDEDAERLVVVAKR